MEIGKHRYTLLALLLGLSVVLWRRPVATTVQLAWLNEAYAYIFLIVPLSLGLIHTRREEIDLGSAPSLPEGGIILATSALLAGVATFATPTSSGDLQLSLDILALALWWLGSVFLCFGKKTVRSLIFPLCLLFLIVPFPYFISSSLIEFLQAQSAAAAFILFRVLGAPVVRDGFVLSIPNLNIEVAQECSSIRSSQMLVITTVVFAHLFLRSNWKKVLLIAASVPLAVAKNALRIVVIAELATRVNPGFLHGNLHHHGGFIFLGLSVLVMSSFVWILHRTEFPDELPARGLKART